MADMKNTNPNVYLMNALHRNECMLCGNLETNLINHYKTIHCKFEVFVARPSPKMAEKIRRRTECFTFTPSTAQISALCFFCEKPRQMSMCEWNEHLIYHTGESKITDASFEKPHKETNVLNDGDDVQLTAFMCKLCNYIQVDDNRVRMHLKTEHEYPLNAQITNNDFEEVILIPNLAPLQRLPTAMNIEYITVESRFKCGIGWCETHVAGHANLKEHLREKHKNTDQTESFSCLHCSEVIKPLDKTFLRDVLQHYELHGRHLFCCLFCERVFSTERDTMLHIMQKHPNKRLAFRHLHRKNWPPAAEPIQEFQIMLLCNICSDIFYTITDATLHFKYHHNTLNIDLTANTLIKCTIPSSTTSIMFNSKSTLTLRQFFECTLCDVTRFNEVSLIKHFTKSHRMNSLILKSGKLFLKCVDDTENNGGRQSIAAGLNSFIRMIFYCFHCYEKEHQFIGYATCQEVCSHWFSTHLTHSEPFRFTVAGIVKCLYCDLRGTYQSLKLHQCAQHSRQTFAIVDILLANKCALCPYIGDQMDKHFKQQHQQQLIDQANVFCPIPLSDANLQSLIETRGQKKYLCGYCGLAFETKDDFKTHHTIKHPSLKENSEKFYDNDSFHLIAGCCQAKLDPNEFFEHLKVHRFPSKCSSCNFETLDLYKFCAHKVNEHGIGNDIGLLYGQSMQLMYWKTKMVYGNGLILNKHNLLGTNRDDSQAFEQFVKKIIQHEAELNI